MRFSSENVFHLRAIFLINVLESETLYRNTLRDTKITIYSDVREEPVGQHDLIYAYSHSLLKLVNFYRLGVLSIFFNHTYLHLKQFIYNLPFKIKYISISQLNTSLKIFFCT